MTSNDSAGVPQFPLEAATIIARDAYGIRGALETLPSEWDQNFHIRAEDGREFSLKIANERADAAFLEAQNTVLRTIEERDPFVGSPRLVRTVAKNDVAKVQGAHDGPVIVDFIVEQDDNVYPMIPAGTSIDQLMEEPTFEGVRR